MELYEADAGLPASSITPVSSTPAPHTTSVSGEYLRALGRLSGLLAEHLDMDITLTPANYYLIVTEEVENRLAKMFGKNRRDVWRIKFGLSVLPKLCDASNLSELSISLGVSAGTVRHVRSSLIKKLGVLERRNIRSPRMNWNTDIQSHDAVSSALSRLSELARSIGINAEFDIHRYEEALDSLGGAETLASSLAKTYELSPYRTPHLTSALKRLRTLSRSDISLEEMATIEGVSKGTVASLRSVLIKIGVCKKRGQYTDEEIKANFRGAEKVSYNDLKRLGIRPTTISNRYGTMEDGCEFLGIEIEPMRPQLERTLESILAAIMDGQVSYEGVAGRTGLRYDTIRKRCRMLEDAGLIEGKVSSRKSYQPTEYALKAAAALKKLGLEVNLWNMMRYASLPLKAIYIVGTNRDRPLRENVLCNELGITPEECQGLEENPMFREFIVVRKWKEREKHIRFYGLPDCAMKSIRGFFEGDIKHYPTCRLPRLDELLLGPKAVKQRRIMKKYHEVTGRRKMLAEILSVLYHPSLMNFGHVTHALNEELFSGRKFVRPRDVMEWVIFYRIDPKIEEAVRGRCEEIAGFKGVPYIINDFISRLPAHEDENAICRLVVELGLAPEYVYSLAGAYMENGYMGHAERRLRKRRDYDDDIRAVGEKRVQLFSKSA